ncbi:MAG TPA: efflux RND transporter periplasmic adaptor subunit [Kofleriaceae bacterium]|jgi:cobalt-zinc-cadmium efflux system membrane fusion protein|nr:efflux RND transporter periplasmic adaptor subunit [Kofleriaceae bacterium]
MAQRIAVLISAAAVCVACGDRDRDDDEKRPPSRVQGGAIVLDERSRAALDLVIAAAVEADLPEVRIRYGRVVARPGDELVIASPIAGRVVRVERAIGDRIASGDEIARISPSLGAAERASLGVQSAEITAQVTQAEEEVRLREAEAARAHELARDGIVSQAKLQESDAAVATTRARLQAARQGLAAQAGAVGRAMPLVAPADGTLVALDAAPGAGLDAGRPVARVLRAGPRRIDLAVHAADPAASAYEAQIEDRWVPARLIARAMAVGEDGNRHDVLELDAGAQPLVGAVVAVRLAAGNARGPVVPESALLAAAGGDVVYVEDRPGRFEPRVVQVAARLAGRVRIAAGVKPGDRVVVRGAAALRGEALRSSLGDAED